MNCDISVKPPDTLFHYTTIDAALKILAGGTLRWSSPLTFNDPFDCMWGWDTALWTPQTIMWAKVMWTALISGTMAVPRGPTQDWLQTLGRFQSNPSEAKEFLDTFESRMTSVRDQLRSAYPDMANKCRLLCLAREPKSLLMWAHYAQDHRGVVLEIDPRKLLLDTERLYVQPVKYADEFPDLWARGLAIPTIVFGVRPELATQLFNEMIHTKSSDWAYEDEWRAFINAPDEVDTTPHFYDYAAGCIKSVTIGVRVSSSETKPIRRVLEGLHPHATQKKARLSTKRFEVETFDELW